MAFFGLFKKRPTSSSRKEADEYAKRINARYDAAQKNREDRNHWAYADNLSPVQANSKAVRDEIKKKSRYELDNNGSGAGIVKSYTNDVVGTVPSINVITGNENTDELIQKRFKKYSNNIHLGRKLRLARRERLISGESFIMQFNNRGSKNPVKLDIQVIDSDLITDPEYDPLKTSEYQNVDGIFYDKYRNPVKYRMLKVHPNAGVYTPTQEYVDISAEFMFHWYDELRAGQVRGVPELTATILEFANLRRYTKAVLGAAEISAELTGMLESDGTANEDGPDELGPGDELPIKRNMLTTLPMGWKLNMTKPEQPTTSYGDFKKEVLTDVARPLCMPRNIANGSSADYNYSSGKLDFLSYAKNQGIERHDLEETFLNDLFFKWLEEALMIPGYIPNVNPEDVEIEWSWDSDEDIDPVKGASANEIRLNTGETTLKEIYSRKNRDWRVALEQRAAEIALQRELGIPLSTDKGTQNVDQSKQQSEDGSDSGDDGASSD
jgi:capsid protein